MKLSTEKLIFKEPDELIEILKSSMKWGPINSGIAVHAGFRCEYCKQCMLESVVHYYSWEIDHITPDGGDSHDNCALACRTCNHLKHTYNPVGETREDRIRDATRQISARREKREEELAKVRMLVGWKSSTGT